VHEHAGRKDYNMEFIRIESAVYQGGLIISCLVHGQMTTGFNFCMATSRNLLCTFMESPVPLQHSDKEKEAVPLIEMRVDDRLHTTRTPRCINQASWQPSTGKKRNGR
jgi:hypothetical protein